MVVHALDDGPAAAAPATAAALGRIGRAASAAVGSAAGPDAAAAAAGPPRGRGPQPGALPLRLLKEEVDLQISGAGLVNFVFVKWLRPTDPSPNL